MRLILVCLALLFADALFAPQSGPPACGKKHCDCGCSQSEPCTCAR